MSRLEQRAAQRLVSAASELQFSHQKFAYIYCVRVCVLLLILFLFIYNIFLCVYRLFSLRHGSTPFQKNNTSGSTAPSSDARVEGQRWQITCRCGGTLQRRRTCSSPGRCVCGCPTGFTRLVFSGNRIPWVSALPQEAGRMVQWHPGPAWSGSPQDVPSHPHLPVLLWYSCGKVDEGATSRQQRLYAISQAMWTA